MIYEDEQKKAFNIFIDALKESLVNWIKSNSLPAKNSNRLGKAINLLIALDKKIPKLEKQIPKIRTLMTIIGRNADKSLSQKTQNRIINLKNSIERMQKEIID